MVDFDESEDRPVFMISVAARLTGMHPQTLRIYERKQLLRPGRTAKSTRLYSQKDITRLKYIQQLTQEEGVNLAGVKIIMDLQRELEGIRRHLVQAEEQVVEAERHLARELGRSKRYQNDLVLVPKGELVRITQRWRTGVKDESG